MSRLRSLSFVLIGSLILGGPACDSVAAPTAGTLDVSVTGYPPGLRLPLAELSIVIDGDTHPFQTYDPSPRLVVGSLPPGDRAVTLEGLPVEAPADCQSTDGTERTATIVAGAQTYLSFDLACTWGTLRILTATMGVNPDSDGYGVELIRECSGYYYYYYDECEPTVVADIAVPSDGTVVAPIAADLTQFTYTATLTGVAANCAAPAPLTFVYPAQAHIGFSVACSASSASRAGGR